MDATHHIPYLREVVVFLVAAGIVVPVVQRLKISPVLGYLIVGGLIGPFGLGLFLDRAPWLAHVVVADVDGVKTLAEFGVVFLLFVIGLELSLDRLWTMRRLVFGLGGLQVLISATVIGAIAWGFGNSPQASIVLGACLALSSTAIVMQLLIERRRLGTELGRSSFSILLFQDLAVVPILFLLGVFGARMEMGIGLALGLALLKAAIVIVGIFVVGRLMLRPLFRLVASRRSAETFMAAILLTVIGTAMITDQAGLSMALGAFLAGLLIGETEYRHEVEVDIEPFKGLLLALFFMSVGMGIDYRVVGDLALWIALSVIGLFAIKAAIAGGLCFAFGLPRHVALEAGLLLGQGGEFAFVVVGLAMSLGLVPSDVGHFMLIVAGVSMIITPLVAAAGRRLAAAVERWDRAAQTDTLVESVGAVQGHVILAGYGRIGRMMGELLDAEGIPYLALDSDPRIVAAARGQNVPIYFGDASKREMLRRAQPDIAAALVLTLNDAAANARIVRAVRREWPRLPIHARAHDEAHARHLLALGANVAVPEAAEAALQMGVRLLAEVGIPTDLAQRRIDGQRTALVDALRS